MKKFILILFLILFLSSCNYLETDNNTDLMTPDEKTNNIETNNPETNNPETDNKPTIETNTPLSYVIKEPNFETRKISSIDEVTMDDFFNLGNRIDIKINISNEELKKLQADYETGYKSEIYRLASKVVITLTNFGNKYTWEYENVGIRQKGNTSRIPIYNGDGNINLNHYKLSFDEYIEKNDLKGFLFDKVYLKKETVESENIFQLRTQNILKEEDFVFGEDVIKDKCPICGKVNYQYDNKSYPHPDASFTIIFCSIFNNIRRP